MLHPDKDINDETTPLNKADKTFRLQCMKAMDLDPRNQVITLRPEFFIYLFSGSSLSNLCLCNHDNTLRLIGSFILYQRQLN